MVEQNESNKLQKSKTIYTYIYRANTLIVSTQYTR